MRRALAGDLYHLGACAVKRYLRWIQSNYWGAMEIRRLRGLYSLGLSSLVQIQ